MRKDNNKIDNDRLISNIDELAKNSRNIYLTYLVVLTFILITLFGITDLDMIKDSYQVELPIVGRNMPIGLFFIAVPILCLGLFIYMNLYFLELDQLIKLLFKRNPDLDSAELYPWLFIFSEYPRTNNYKVIGVLEKILIKFIRWWLLPIVLLFISLKYVKVHDRPLSYLLVGLTILSCIIILFLWIFADWNNIKKIFETKMTKNVSNILKKILSILNTFIFKLLYILLFASLIQNYLNFLDAGTGKINLINSDNFRMIINCFKSNNIDNHDFVQQMENRSNKETDFKDCNLKDIFHSGQIQFKDISSYNKDKRWEVYRIKLLFELSKSDNNLKELLKNKLRKNYIFQDNEIQELEKKGIKFND